MRGIVVVRFETMGCRFAGGIRVVLDVGTCWTLLVRELLALNCVSPCLFLVTSDEHEQRLASTYRRHIS